MRIGGILPAVLMAAAAAAAAAATAGEETIMPAEEYEPVPPEDRLVGIAYTNWHREPPWHDVWSTPLLGEYASSDREVIRQHARWLADAGVDFVWLDWSNNVAYFPEDDEERWRDSGQEVIEDATAILFEEYAQMDPDERPDISIFIGITHFPEAVEDGRLQRKADQVYDMYVAHPEYGPMMQRHLGKPLLVVYTDTPTPWPDGLPPWDDDRFTVRWMTGYVTEQGSLRTDDLVSKYGYWSWEDRGKQTFPVHDGRPESMVVVASWRPQAEPGDANYVAPGPRDGGRTFREQWARAREVGPKFAMVVSWNEWVKGEQFSEAISKDLEPSEAFGTFYLELLKEEIARFKGAKPAE
jgi:hypothetical protein